MNNNFKEIYIQIRENTKGSEIREKLIESYIEKGKKRLTSLKGKWVQVKWKNGKFKNHLDEF